MADEAAMYRKRAEDERSNAATATLSNVKDRCERAAQSWDAMAARIEHTQKLRAARESAVVDRIAADRESIAAE